MYRHCFLLLFVFVGLNASFGQNLQKMQVWEDSLSNLGKQIFANPSEMERIESNFIFVKSLVSSLKETNSYFYNFDKLNMISTVKSPDDKFRIFTWNVPLNDGSYLYYGCIQQRSGTLKLIPLLDKTFEIKNENKDVLTNKQWYGVQYYEIIPLQLNSYLLLGWKGHHADLSKKVIEVLSFNTKGEAFFGSAIFSDDSSLTRKVFTYFKQATMYLRYNKIENRIEFDHLVPLEGGKKDQYVPDLTHDAYLIRQNKLHLQKNIVVLNNEA